MSLDISQQNVREHWLPAMFKAVAVKFDNPELELEAWEMEIWAPAVTGIVNKYLPELLAKTDSPEWALMGVAVVTYAGKRWGMELLGKLPMVGAIFGAPTSEAGTATVDSPVASQSSETPAPEKPIEQPSSFPASAVAFGSTQ